MADLEPTTMDECNEQLEEEVKKWYDEFGTDPKEIVSPNVLLHDVYIRTMIEILTETELTTEEEIILRASKTLLKDLKEHRKIASEARRAAIVQQIVPQMQIPKN
jgi:uncharacterized protein YbcI